MAGEILEPADVFFTKGHGIISRLIRVFTTRIGEKRTMVNHVGLVSEGGRIEVAVVIEALSKVKRHRLIDQHGGQGTEVAVYRPLNISQQERDTIVAKATKYLNQEYGYPKIVLHFLDWLLQGAYVFRRLGMDQYPICSWLVAFSYAKVGRRFGVEPEAASPDDIWDFVEKHRDQYQLIRKLSPFL